MSQESSNNYNIDDNYNLKYRLVVDAYLNIHGCYKHIVGFRRCVVCTVSRFGFFTFVACFHHSYVSSVSKTTRA